MFFGVYVRHWRLCGAVKISPVAPQCRCKGKKNIGKREEKSGIILCAAIRIGLWTAPFQAARVERFALQGGTPSGNFGRNSTDFGQNRLNFGQNHVALWLFHWSVVVLLRLMSLLCRSDSLNISICWRTDSAWIHSNILATKCADSLHCAPSASLSESMSL